MQSVNSSCGKKLNHKIAQLTNPVIKCVNCFNLNTSYNNTKFFSYFIIVIIHVSYLPEIIVIVILYYVALI